MMTQTTLPPLSPSQLAKCVMSDAVFPIGDLAQMLSSGAHHHPTFHRDFAVALGQEAGALAAGLLGEKKDQGSFQKSTKTNSTLDQDVLDLVVSRVLPALDELKGSSFTMGVNEFKIGLIQNVSRWTNKLSDKKLDLDEPIKKELMERFNVYLNLTPEERLNRRAQLSKSDIENKLGTVNQSQAPLPVRKI